METVEVTDVRILSSTLFSNLQTKFREQNRKTAELHTMTVNNEIEEERLKHDTEQSKRDADNSKQRKLRQFADELASMKRVNQEYAK